MANHKSAIKRAKQSQGRRLRNRSAKTTLKTLEKKLRAVKEAGENSDEILRKNQSALHKAAKKGIIHKKTASRKISRLFKFMNA